MGLRRGDAAPAQQHFDARSHLVGREWLGQIVVAARAQAAHARIDVGQRADHQHRRIHAGAAQFGDQGQPVELGQHAVEGDRVVGPGQSALEAFAAIADAVDLIAVVRQLGDDFTRGQRVVFDRENFRHAAKCAAIRRGRKSRAGRRG